MTGILVYIALLTRITTNPLANVFQKKLSLNGHHPTFINFVTYLGLSLLAEFGIDHIPWRALPHEFWILATLSGLAGSLGNNFLIKSLQKGELSVLGPINSYKSIIAVFFGFFMLGEIPNFWGLMGMLLIIYGSYWVLDAIPAGFSCKLLHRKDIQYRIWAMILTAIEAVWIKKLILMSSIEIAWISWCWFGAIFSFFFLVFSRIDLKKSVSQINALDTKMYFYLLVSIGLMQFTTTYLLEKVPVAYALALFQSSLILTVILGKKFFNESNIKKKLMGAIIMIAGSLLLILLKDTSVSI